MYALIGILFVVGYLAIAFEHSLKIDKAAIAILTAVLTWTALILADDLVLPAAHALPHSQAVVHALREHLGEIAEILFFLLGAMTIVELIDAHQGFQVITDRIQTTHKVTLLWLVGFIAFFLSAVLDNLTTTIVMISLLRSLIANQRDRWFFAGIVVIAANAGGAWSPIGDVTTTMLWIGNQITASGIMRQLILPSLVCLIAPLLILSFVIKGHAERPAAPETHDEDKLNPTSATERNIVFALGLGALLFVPVFKTLTHLPPYMGVLLGLSVLWLVTELLHRSKNAETKHPFSVIGVLQRIDTPSILFFLGILLAVSSLSTAGHLLQVAGWLKDTMGNLYAINLAIGLLSAIVDNVPLVAGAMNMYPLVTHEQLQALPITEQLWAFHLLQDGSFWEMLAYCAGTGGSCLIIGSAAGVAAMGLERISFFWYLRYISLLALIGYLAGAAVYILPRLYA